MRTTCVRGNFDTAVELENEATYNHVARGFNAKLRSGTCVMLEYDTRQGVMMDRTVYV